MSLCILLWIIPWVFLCRRTPYVNGCEVIHCGYEQPTIMAIPLSESNSLFPWWPSITKSCSAKGGSVGLHCPLEFGLAWSRTAFVKLDTATVHGCIHESSRCLSGCFSCHIASDLSLVTFPEPWVLWALDADDPSTAEHSEVLILSTLKAFELCTKHCPLQEEAALAKAESSTDPQI